MLTFYGYDLELAVGGVVENDPLLHWGEDPTGVQWLIALVDQDPDHLVWVCAPITTTALQAVTSGRASARDAVRHSATGTVEVVTVDHGRAVPDRCFCCGAIPSHVLPSAGRLAA